MNEDLDLWQEEDRFRDLSLNAEGQDPGAFEQTVYRSLGDVETKGFAVGRNRHFEEFEEAPFGNYSKSTWDQSSSPFGATKSKQAPVARMSEVVAPPESEEDEPPRAPTYVEPNYHFKSISNPMELFYTIGEVLKAANVDFTVKVFKYKYKCVCYRNGESIPFDVRVFSLSSSGAKEYVVEFQRRKGDVMQFASVYHNLKAVLGAQGHVVEASQTSRSSFDMDLSDLPEGDPPTTEEYEQTVQCLVAMFSSNCVDIQAQAIQALAQLTIESEEVKRVVFGSGWSVLRSAVKSSIEDIHRCAVSGIANLLQDSREVAECVERTQGLIASVVELVSSEVLQVARESARALANLGKQIGRGVTDEFKQNLRKLPQAEDTLTQAYLLELQSAVGVVV